MKTKFFAVIAFIFFLFSFSMAEADYTSWQDSSYDFKAVKTVYIGSMDTSDIMGPLSRPLPKIYRALSELVNNTR